MPLFNSEKLKKQLCEKVHCRQMFTTFLDDVGSCFRPFFQVMIKYDRKLKYAKFHFWYDETGKVLQANSDSIHMVEIIEFQEVIVK